MRIFLIFLVFCSLIFAKELNNIDDLKAFVKDGQQKGYFPKKILNHLSNPVSLNFDFKNTLLWTKNSYCDPHESYIIKTQDDAYVKCTGRNDIYFLGDGNNFIVDPYDTSIIVFGSGDDNVSVGHNESQIFIFEKNWGVDELNFNNAWWNNKIKEYSRDFLYKFKSFLIFASGIKANDLVWFENDLINEKTGDYIKVGTRLINIFFKDEVVHEAFVPYYERIVDMKILNLAQKNDDIYILNGEKNTIIKAKNDKSEFIKVNNEIKLENYAKTLEISDNFVFVAERTNDNIGFLNIFDMDLNLLDRISFNGSIFDIAIYKNYLYVLQNSGFFTHNLHIYDISKKPKFMDKFSVKHLLDLNILGDFLVSPLWNNNLIAYDLKNPLKPKEIWVKNEFKDSNNFRFGKKTDFFAYIKQGAWRDCYGECDSTQKEHDDEIFIYKIKKNGEVQLVWQFISTNSLHEVSKERKNSLIFSDDLLIADDNGVYQVTLNDAENKIKVLKAAKNIFNLDKILIFTSKNGNILKTNEKLSKKPNIPNLKIKKEKPLSQDQIQALLYKTADLNSYEETKKYCQMGAKPNSKGHERSTPIQRAIRLGSVNSLKAMLEYVDVITRNTFHSVMYAKNPQIQLELLKVIDEAIKNGKYSSGFSQFITNDMETLLHFAAYKGDLELIKYLIQKGIDPNLRRKQGENAHEIAQKYNPNKEVILYLKNITK